MVKHYKIEFKPTPYLPNRRFASLKSAKSFMKEVLNKKAMRNIATLYRLDITKKNYGWKKLGTYKINVKLVYKKR